MLEKAAGNIPPPPRTAAATGAPFARDPAEYRPSTQLTLIGDGKEGTP